MRTSISEQIAGFIAVADFNDIPECTLSYTKERVLDIIGACLAGSRGWQYSTGIVKGLKGLAMGSSTVIGCRERLSCPAAAMVNTAFGHAMELDDGHKNAGVHAGTVVVPTALAVGETLHSSGKEVLASIVLGYEIIYRIARNINPAQITKGFHPSATCGTFGAAAVTAKLLGLNEKQIGAALGLSGLQTAGLMEATISGQASKGVMVGHAAFAGIVSAWLSKEDIVGPDSIFEGRHGVFNTMSEKIDRENVLKGLGTRFEIADTYTKLYPTCRHIHPVIEGIIGLKERYGFSEDDVLEVAVGTHKVAAELTGNIFGPEDSAEARFSTPFITAIALKEGTVGMRHLEAGFLTDPHIREIAQLVRVRVDEEIDSIFPRKRGARVAVVLKDGTRLENTIFDLKGSPGLPVDRDIINNKFIACASGVLPQERISQIIAITDRFEDLEDVGIIMKLLCQQEEY